jgi:hypothetical protein
MQFRGLIRLKLCRRLSAYAVALALVLPTLMALVPTAISAENAALLRELQTSICTASEKAGADRNGNDPHMDCKICVVACCSAVIEANSEGIELTSYPFERRTNEPMLEWVVPLHHPHQSITGPPRGPPASSLYLL